MTVVQWVVMKEGGALPGLLLHGKDTVPFYSGGVLMSSLSSHSLILLH
jgi:hypothetical protein